MKEDIKEFFCCYCGDKMIKKKVASKEKIYPSKGETIDHIPQQCLYEGYSSEYKTNRITVPACRDCNDRFSKIENDLRDLIGLANNNNELQKELTKAGVKSIFNQKNWQNRLFTDSNGIIRTVEFELKRIEQNHIKNFKGIYFNEFNSIVPKDYEINIIDKPNTHDTVNYILRFLEINGQWKISGHEDIFRYKIVPFKGTNKKVVKAENIDESIGVFTLFDYHKSILILVFGFKKEWLLNKK